MGEGLVVISDSFDSGWRASVDGTDTPVFRAGGFARAVLLPPDGHTLVMTYQPKSWIWGLRISLMTVLIFILQAAWFNVRKRVSTAVKSASI